MARRERSRDPDRLAGVPQLVEVEVIDQAGMRDGARTIDRVSLVHGAITLLLVAALVALVLTTVAGGDHRGVHAKPSLTVPNAAPSSLEHHLDVEAAVAREPGPAGVAAAYGYPLPCLSVTIAPSDRAYARADYNRASACGRYDGTVTAIFHRVDGEWRIVLDATGYSCPIAALSRAVATELDVCP
jgi:hypothetical protein